MRLRAGPGRRILAAASERSESMPGKIENRLSELGVTLPPAPAPAANYVPWVKAGGLLHVSGQISSGPGGLICGRLGESFDIAQGAAAARACAISLLAQVKAACDGDLDRLVRVVKLNAFVNSAPSFTDQPKVVNGASDFLAEVLGEAGRHARSAVGVAALPLGVAVEIDGTFEIR
jgi:enamine deaminase RidA (YjgF/YER057c/UK114 family)